MRRRAARLIASSPAGGRQEVLHVSVHVAHAVGSSRYRRDSAAAERQNGGMTVTPEIIGVIIAAFGAAATVLGGVAALNARMVHRIDARFDRLEADVVELKVAVARLEGPQPRLLRP